MAGEEWVLHAASQDLACLREVGLDPDRIFDTELGARLLGFDARRPRAGRRAAARPAPRQGALRGRLVDAAAARVVARLRGARRRAAASICGTARPSCSPSPGKAAIAEQEFEAVRLRETRPAPARAVAAPVRHALRPRRPQPRRRPGALAGPRRVRPRDRLRARAGSSPTPPSSPWPARLPASKRELAAMRELHRPRQPAEIDRWWAAIEAGLAATDLPNMRVPSRRAAAAARLGRPQPRRGSPAEGRPRRGGGGRRASCDLPTENLLTPDTLRRVAWAPPAPSTAEAIGAALAAQGARPWQVEATADAIAAAFVRAAQTPPRLRPRTIRRITSPDLVPRGDAIRIDPRYAPDSGATGRDGVDRAQRSRVRRWGSDPVRPGRREGHVLEHARRRPRREGDGRAARAQPAAAQGARRRRRHRGHHADRRPGPHARPHRRAAGRAPPHRARLRDRPDVRRRHDVRHDDRRRHRVRRLRRRRSPAAWSTWGTTRWAPAPTRTRGSSARSSSAPTRSSWARPPSASTTASRSSPRSASDRYALRSQQKAAAAYDVGQDAARPHPRRHQAARPAGASRPATRCCARRPRWRASRP